MNRKCALLTMAAAGICGLLPPGQAALAGFDVREAEWSGAGGDSVWENPGNWVDEDGDPLGRYPDNAVAPYFEWECLLSSDAGEVFVNIGQDGRPAHTVSRIDVQTSGDGKIDLGSTTGEYWTDLAAETLCNRGDFELDRLDIIGDVVNHGRFEFEFGEEVEIEGNFTNETDGTVWVSANAHVAQDFINNGQIWIDATDEFSVDGTFHNHADAVVNLQPGSCFGLWGSLVNDPGSAIRGAGTLESDLIQNNGLIQSARGDLWVGSPCELVTTGTLANTAGTSLCIENLEGSVNHTGQIDVRPDGSVTFMCDLVNPPGAEIDLLGGALCAPNITHQAGATFGGFGTIDLPAESGAGTLTNQGEMEFYADTRLLGHLDNQADAAIIGRNGDLIVVGDLTNEGQITWTNGGVYWEGTYGGTGTLTLDGDEVKAANGTMALASGGLLEVTGTGPAHVYADIDSAGTVTVAPGATAVFRGGLSGAGSYQNDGAMEFDGSVNSPSMNMGAIQGAGSVELTGGASVTAAGLRQRSVTVAEACSLAVGPGPVVLDEPLQVDVAELGQVVFQGTLQNSGAETLTKTGPGTLVIGGQQEHGADALLEILAGTVAMNSDASGTEDMTGANLSILVAGAQLDFGHDQHLDTLEIAGDGLVRFTGADVVMVENLVMDGVPLGPTTLTPEPATLALLAAGAAAMGLKRRRKGGRHR